ncbi:MAG: hypothetical protein II956_01640 [Bacteroidales bacterium]|nr:hypothetical protein [Bacteroidales bacterium]
MAAIATFNLPQTVPFSDFKVSIIEKILGLNSMNLLSAINDLLTKNSPQEPELKPYTIDEINQMIDESLEDIKAGRVYTTEEVDKKMRAKYKWLK